MALKRIFLSILFTFIALTAVSDTTLFSKLVDTVELKPDEKLAVIYQTSGSCIKCYMQPLDKIKKMQKEGKIDKIKILALVRCSRDLELQVFKRNHEWKHYMYRDDGSAKKELGVKTGSYLTIFDNTGKIIFDFE